MTFQRVYLKRLDHALLPARYSVGSKRRAAQLQQFLSPLQAVAMRLLATEGAVELVVVNQKDWRKLFSYPYGPTFTRNHPKAKHSARVSLVAPADYTPRFLHRFDDVLLLAGQAGMLAPGDIREFLDLLIGHEWGHATANLSGMRFRVAWFDEFLATFIYLCALQETGHQDVLQRFIRWSELVKVGTLQEDLTFEAMSGRRTRSFTATLQLQSILTLKAAEIMPQGWRFVHAVKQKMTGQAKAALPEMLIDLEPDFAPWLAELFPSETHSGA